MSGLSRSRIAILTYHRVVQKPDSLRPLQTHAIQFESQAAVLSRWFNVLPLREACARQQLGTLPPRAAVITFDDGYADNLSIAIPILKKYGLAATFFVATGYLNGGRMWNDTVIEAVRSTSLEEVDLGFLGMERMTLTSGADRRRAIKEIIRKAKYFPEQERSVKTRQLATALKVWKLPGDLMMTDADLRRIHSEGMEVGGHTVNHPILDQLPLEHAKEEILQGRKTLEALLDTEISSFAYPNGRPSQDYQAAHVVAVGEAGFDLAVSTAWGPVRRSDDPLQLPRVGFTEFRPFPLFLRLMRCYWDPVATKVER